MTKSTQMIYLIVLLLLHFSCAEEKAQEVPTIESKIEHRVATATLKFTSGIRSIFQDSNGNYWFGSLQEGVAVYNGKSFTYFTNQDGLTDNQIHNIQEDKKGVIWFNTLKGVSSYDGTRMVNHTKTKIDVVKNIIPTQINEPLKPEWSKTDDDLWFEASIQQGAYRYDGQKLNYLAFPIQNSNFNLYAVTGISKGKNNMIWFGTYAGVFGYNGDDFTIINDETLGYGTEVPPLHVRSILEDSKGRLWIGNNGIGVLLKQGEDIVNFSEKNYLIHPTSARRGDKSLPGTLEHVFTIAEDSQGNIWFGDRDAGIWKYDGVTMTNYTKEDGLANDNALAIYEDNKHGLWFGMADGSVYKFNGSSFDRKF